MKNNGGFLVPSVIEIPKNKWQAFKIKYFPFWLRDIFPIKAEKIDVKKKLLDSMRAEKIDVKKNEREK